MIFMTFLIFGPMAPGAHGAPFSDFLKICKMVRDLSRSVPMMFRTPGNPLINLFHLICNSKCHFFECRFFIQLPIELPIVLLIVSPIELPIGGHVIPIKFERPIGGHINESN